MTDGQDGTATIDSKNMMNFVIKNLFFSCLLLSGLVRSSNAAAYLQGPQTCGVQQNYTDAMGVEACQDAHWQCEEWAEDGECLDNGDFMLVECPCSCNSCPTYSQNDWDDEPQYAMGPLKEEIEYIIQTTEEYMVKYTKYVSSSYDECRNMHKGCSHWALMGECEDNEDFMVNECAPACQSCHKAEDSSIPQTRSFGPGHASF